MGVMVDKARQAIDKVNQLGELKDKIFTEFDEDRILKAAGEAEDYCAQNPGAALAGVLVSVKDLYDEAGIATTAASELLKGRAPAEADSECVRRIKAAGAIPFGRTTLSEFAYSGVGLNPHYGTPGNIFDAEGIPGGSTSGGGLTVAHGIVDLALGTDTGGSIRIPSAINGLYGIKPSRLSVPGAGIHPLAKSFDTPGPLAGDLETAIRAFEVLTDITVTPPEDAAKSLRIGVPMNAFVDGLDDRVKADFAMICAKLKDAGHELIEIDFAFIAQNAILNKMLVSFEAHRIYAKDFAKLETVGDPRVLSRMKFADTLSSDEVIDAYAKRTDLVSLFGTAMADVDVMIAPTLPRMAPKITEVEADFDNLNALMLRNTGYLNLVDACALSMPVPVAGEVAPAALMIGAPHGQDQAILAAARLIDPLFA